MTQRFIADPVAEDIVDELEVIDVKLHKDCLIHLILIESLLDHRLETVAVEQPRELICHCQTTQTFLPIVHVEQNVCQHRQHDQGQEAESDSHAQGAHDLPAVFRGDLHVPLAAAVRKGVADGVSRRYIRLQYGHITIMADPRLLESIGQARLIQIGNCLGEDVRHLDEDICKSPQ